MNVLTVFDSPVISGIITPILVLIAMAVLKYVQKEVTTAINGTKESVLTEVKKVDTKVDGVIKEQVTVREELLKTQEDHHLVKERVARLEGRRDAQIEAAQIANATATAVDVLTHRQEESK
jgi:hypothetical protein